MDKTTFLYIHTINALSGFKSMKAYALYKYHIFVWRPKMREFIELTSVDTIQHFINEHPLSFIYISRTNCSVCHSLLPQVREVMADFPEIQLGSVNADDVEDVAGYFSIFTVPVLLLFVEGKEYVREARFVPIEPFKEKIEKIYQGYIE